MLGDTIFDDTHLSVRDEGFNADTGKQSLSIHEKHVGVGFYYINVVFESNNATRLSHDGGNPNRLMTPIVQTPKRGDAVKEITVKRVPGYLGSDLV